MNIAQIPKMGALHSQSKTRALKEKLNDDIGYWESLSKKTTTINLIRRMSSFYGVCERFCEIEFKRQTK